MRRLGFLLALLVGVTAAVPEVATAAEQPLRRKIVVLYDGSQIEKIRESVLHQSIELPLNHLGLVVRYHDLRHGLPTDKTMAGARGIMTWFDDRMDSPPDGYVAWLNRQLDVGRRLVMFEHPGIRPSADGSEEGRTEFRRLMARIGVDWRDVHHRLTYAAKVAFRDRALMGFERPLPLVLPRYNQVVAVGDGARRVVSVSQHGKRADVIVLGPAGAYLTAAYALHYGQRLKPPVRAWHLNPFKFFRIAFATQGLPKPDITTMSGRRIYYSHIDGDGWRNLVRQARFKKLGLNAAEVMHREIFQRYTDLPVTLGPVVGDLDPKWYGSQREIDLAREIFRLPHVEAGHHTHSHPFQWGFFRRYRPSKERPFLSKYPARPGEDQADSVYAPPGKSAPGDKGEKLAKGYDRPRAYAVKPYNLKQEVSGAAAFIQRLLPAGKKVALYQWSGNTAPYPAAIAATVKAGMRNLNGGDGRMYRQYRSYAYVAPYGRWVGDLWQPYTSQSNENIYTDLWRGRFFAFVHLIESLRNTGRPLRVMPINVYYHLYLAEREQGLSSLKHVLAYVGRIEIAPIHASRFAAMSDGFVRTRLVRVGKRRWRVEARDGIETLRFDRASADCVDFARSAGVTGQRHFQGSLYVSLDGAVKKPVVALKVCNAFADDPKADVPYLVHSRWRAWGLNREDARRFAYRTIGFGPGAYHWRVPVAGAYRIEAKVNGNVVFEKTVRVGADLKLKFELPRTTTEMQVAIASTAEVAQ